MVGGVDRWRKTSRMEKTCKRNIKERTNTDDGALIFDQCLVHIFMNQSLTLFFVILLNKNVGLTITILITFFEEGKYIYAPSVGLPLRMDHHLQTSPIAIST